MMLQFDINKIVDKFLNAQSELVLQSSDLSLGSIASMVKDEAIDIKPKYQRRARWDVEKQSALIESFLLNIPVPPIFLAEDEYGKYSVIDGKQRITAINKFINEGLELKSLERFKELEGFTFAELPPQLNNALKIRPYIRVITLLKQSSPTLKYEVFTRLNTGGESLLPQEIRNVAFMGNMNDLVFELADNDFLKKQLKITSENSKAYREMLDAEYVLRFFTLRKYWENFPGVMKDAMDAFMSENRSLSSPELAELEKLFNDTIGLCQVIWGENSFKRPEGGTFRNQILQGVFDVQMVALSFFLEEKDSIIKNQDLIRKFFIERYDNDFDFQESIRQFTSNTERVHYRIAGMMEIVLAAIK
jgi:hypothetical protein